MNKNQKTEAIALLKAQFSEYAHFYVTNTESLSVAQVNTLRRSCHQKNIVLKVAKNTLVKKALDSIDIAKYEAVYQSLHGVTALMFSHNPKEPALILTSFRDANPKVGSKPSLKLAYLGGEVFVGDEQLNYLKNLKTKEEVVGEIIGMLQAPLRNILSGLSREDRQGKQEAGAVEVAPAADLPPVSDAPAQA